MTLTFATSQSSVTRLCAFFATNREALIAPDVKEAHVRQMLIDPLLEALGWDVRNQQQTAPQYREVIPEDTLDVEGQQRAPDYTVRVGTLPKFYVEAKRCAVDISSDPSPAYQLKRYGWSGRTQLSVLTNFCELAVYDCSYKPRPTDRPSRARVALIPWDQYCDRWQEVWGLLSREAVWSGAFDAFGASKRKRGTSPVDEEFLKEIESWRNALAHNVALRNPSLSADDLNACVQRIIDRIVFLRMAEDRGIEPYKQLDRLCDSPDVYQRFVRDLCRKADERYNSGLFHFDEEPGNPEPPDRLTPRLMIDDRVFKPILQGLYFEHGSPYHFGVLPVEILGTVYERFLGKTIRLTVGHRARVEDKPEVRKAGGVYYTPAYLVEFLVKHTVRVQTDGRSPAQLASRKGGGPFRVLDMACGSGSFLLGAYQALLDHCLSWYLVNGPAEHPDAIYKDEGSGKWRLTIEEKKRILITHVFGVDIDQQAVEVSGLSLLLKVLEGETDQSVGRQIQLFHRRALPSLASNLRCGNSLIGSNFFHAGLLPGLTCVRRVNFLDWNYAFPDAVKAGGFDCIIGNPPWGATLDPDELAYLRAHHSRVVTRMVDSYIYFADKALTLVKPGGRVGLVLPATVLNQVDASRLRELLLARGVSVLVNLGQGIFGRKVLNTSAVVVSGPAPSQIVLADLSPLPVEARGTALNAAAAQPNNAWQVLVRSDTHRTFLTKDLKAGALVDRLRRRWPPLSNCLEGTIERGVSPDVVSAHVVSPAEARKLKLERGLLRPSISGEQIKRYHPWSVDQFIIYTRHDTRIADYPRCLAHLQRFRHNNTCKEVAQRKHPWWALHRPRDPAIFAAPKLIGLTTTRTIALALDEADSLWVTDAMYVFRPTSAISPKALMGVMHSSVFRFLYAVANIGEARVIPQIKASKLLPLPVPGLDSCGRLIQEVEGMLALHARLLQASSRAQRELVQRQLADADEALNQLVMDLYELDAPDRALVIETTRMSPADGASALVKAT